MDHMSALKVRTACTSSTALITLIIEDEACASRSAIFRTVSAMPSRTTRSPHSGLKPSICGQEVWRWRGSGCVLHGHQ